MSELSRREPLCGVQTELRQRVRKGDASAETSDWHGLPRPLVGHDLYEVGKALVDLSGLD